MAVMGTGWGWDGDGIAVQNPRGWEIWMALGWASAKSATLFGMMPLLSPSRHLVRASLSLSRSPSRRRPLSVLSLSSLFSALPCLWLSAVGDDPETRHDTRHTTHTHTPPRIAWNTPEHRQLMCVLPCASYSGVWCAVPGCQVPTYTMVRPAW
ncbi:hypothetical protein BGZ61DRAFT_458618 [Ilyonectria robusta]|uniref:uncharacterized protein n=1 Tax=Ilyonectria robusta TaxID=1079257 RepID=UPI001E8D3E6B|nr:uncharacterized protein BGZ61DRAFT_458618 [Ilyonectria robusta]KAH8672986.1 hypothetical protein BGZ61DRAFT_458618 [Ilyonectria robusta]